MDTTACETSDDYASSPGQLDLGRLLVQELRQLGLADDPRAVTYAEEFHQRLGRTPTRTIIRGGADGAQLTGKGLPTPNLSSGQHNPHSPLEWVCLEEMVQSVKILVELVQVWAEQGDNDPAATEP